MTLPPINIIEGSKDYGNNTVILLFSDRTPGQQQIVDYVNENYGSSGEVDQIEIREPSVFRGLENLGSIRVTFVGK